MEPPLKQIRFILGKYGRGSRIRTHTGGFGDRCATINTIPLYVTINILAHIYIIIKIFLKNY